MNLFRLGHFFIPTPFLLVIAGNHDFTLDTPAFRQMLASSPSLTLGENSTDKAVIERKYGAFGEAESLFLKTFDSGIVLLDEGTHRMKLANGAKLTVFASPYTPSEDAS